MKKIQTIPLQGKDYAQVKDRVKEFRSDNPSGLIETTPTIQPNGQILFKARILKDKDKQTSAESTGHALGDNTGVKAFEKLETIAVGRALAFLGYATDGEIASSDEMEEFYEYKNEKREEIISSFSEKIKSSENMDDLKKVWASIDGALKPELNELKELKKYELLDENI